MLWRKLSKGDVTLLQFRHEHIVPATRYVEFGQGMIALGWSFYTAIPAHIFETNPAFAELKHLGPEIAWSAPLHIVAFTCILGWFTGVPWQRFLGAVLSATLWLFIGASFGEVAPSWHGIPLTLGIVSYGTLMILAASICKPLAGYVLADIISGWRKRRDDRKEVMDLMRFCARSWAAGIRGLARRERPK